MEKRMTNPKSEGYISAKDMAGRAAYYKVLQAAKNGELTRIKRGVYATDDHLASQMLDVEKVVPGGVLCLYSAWSHYQLTTQVPQEYCLAIKRGRKITLIHTNALSFFKIDHILKYLNCYYYLFDGAKLIIFLYTLLYMQTLQVNKSKMSNK